MSLTRRWLALLLPLTLLALAGCPEEDDDDSAADDDDTADDDTGDDDAADDDTADDDTGDDDISGDDDTADDDTGDDDTTGAEPDIDVSPTSANFGVLCVGDAPTMQALSVANTGTADLTITDVQIVNCNNAALDPKWPTLVPPGNSAALNVSAQCVMENACSGNLVIESNDPDESPLQIPVIVSCDEC